jgi:hypothetical protein
MNQWNVNEKYTETIEGLTVKIKIYLGANGLLQAEAPCPHRNCRHQSSIQNWNIGAQGVGHAKVKIRQSMKAHLKSKQHKG